MSERVREGHFFTNRVTTVVMKRGSPPASMVQVHLSSHHGKCWYAAILRGKTNTHVASSIPFLRRFKSSSCSLSFIFTASQDGSEDTEECGNSLPMTSPSTHRELSTIKLSHTQVVVRVVEVVRAVEEEERDEGLGEVGEQRLAELPPSHLVHLVQLPVRGGGGEGGG